MLDASIAPFIHQKWDAYTTEQHGVWGQLYARRMPVLEQTASRVFLDGAGAIGLDSRFIPDLASLNRRLVVRTGWSAVPVEGFLPAKEFFQCLARRKVQRHCHASRVLRLLRLTRYVPFAAV